MCGVALCGVAPILIGPVGVPLGDRFGFRAVGGLVTRLVVVDARADLGRQLLLGVVELAGNGFER